MYDIHIPDNLYVIPLLFTALTMIEDLSKTIKAQLYERVNSPLLASFALSWVSWNYRFVIVLFSSMGAPEKFKYIDENLYKTIEEIAYRGAIYPLLTSLFLIFIYPFPAKWVYEFSRKQQRKLKEIQQQIDDETPLTKDEARKLRKEMIKASEEYEQELDKRAAEITRLKELMAPEDVSLDYLIDKNRNQKRDSYQSSNNNSSLLSLEQVELLQMIGESPADQLSEGTIISSLKEYGMDQIHAKHILDVLLNRKFISVSYNQTTGERYFTITPAGREYLVNLYPDSINRTSVLKRVIETQPDQKLPTSYPS